MHIEDTKPPYGQMLLGNYQPRPQNNLFQGFDHSESWLEYLANNSVDVKFPETSGQNLVLWGEK